MQKKYIFISFTILSCFLAGLYFNSVSPVSAETENSVATILTQKGVISPSEDYRFSDTITRKEMMKIVMNLSGKTLGDTCTGQFSDVVNDWGCKYIESALAAGFIVKNATFRPNDTITKAESMKLIVQARGIERIQTTSNWQDDWMQTGFQNGLISTPYSDHNSQATRGGIFTLAANPVVMNQEVSQDSETLDITALPLGDGKLSTSPQVGSVYSCQTNFRRAGIIHTADWIDEENKTWDMTQKIAVIGEVFWDNALFSDTQNESLRVIVGNGLPVEYPTGNFPIAKNDPAYLIDRNPNPVNEQSITYNLPVNPTFADSPSCLPMGAIGVALNGVAIYNSLDAAGADAVAREVQDTCNGHPEKDGEYHYHGPSDCIEGADTPNTLIGYALDGFGIYSEYKADGSRYTNADLDECHGMTSPVLWNGKLQNIYHYVLTSEYPYTLGCFKGEPIKIKKI